MALFFSPFFFLPFFFIFNNFDKPPFDLSLSLFNAEVTQGDQTHDPYLQLAVSTSLSSRLSLFLPDKKRNIFLRANMGFLFHLNRIESKSWKGTA